MTKLLSKTLILPIMLMGVSTPAFAGEISGSVSVDYVTEYVFRGVSYAGAAVQPGAELSAGGFTLGVWSSAALGEASAAAGDEIDVYGGYGWSLSDTLDASVGFTIYHFPDVSGSLFDFGGASTFEVNAGLALDTALSPSVTAYYDFDLEAFTLEGGIGHSFAMSDKTSFDLGATAGIVEASGGGDYQYGQASASLGYALTDDASAYIGANYALSSEDTLGFKNPGVVTKDNLLWFGVGIGVGF